MRTWRPVLSPPPNKNFCEQNAERGGRRSLAAQSCIATIGLGGAMRSLLVMAVAASANISGAAAQQQPCPSGLKNMFGAMARGSNPALAGSRLIGGSLT